MKTKEQKIKYILNQGKNLGYERLQMLNVVVDYRFMEKFQDPQLWSHKLLDKIIHRIK